MFVCSHRGATPARHTEARNRKKEHMSENVDTICVQGGYQPGQRRIPHTPNHPGHDLQIPVERTDEPSCFRPVRTRMTSTPACRTRPTTPSPRKSASWKAARPRCSPRPARRRTSSRSSTSATTATTSSPPPPSTAARSEPHQRDHAQDGHSNAPSSARTAPRRNSRPRSSRTPRPSSASPSPIRRSSCSTSRSSRTQRTATACH